MRLALLLLIGAIGVGTAPSDISRQHAELFQQKLVRIVNLSNGQRDPSRNTTVTQAEVNSYLHYRQAELLPVGVTEPSINIHPQGRLSGRAVVDLDQVREKQGTGGWFDLKSYLMGRLPVTAVGTLVARDGAGRFDLESAAISGVPIPKTFLQEIVSYYTRSADHPNGISIDQVFELPAGIRRIDTDSGKALVVQ